MLALVDLIFCRTLSRFPFIVALERGGYFCNALAVRPGKGGRYPFWSALSNVELVGDHSAPCAKATRSSGFAEALTAWSASCGFEISSCHRPLVVSLRYPRKIM